MKSKIAHRRSSQNSTAKNQTKPVNMKLSKTQESDDDDDEEIE